MDALEYLGALERLRLSHAQAAAFLGVHRVTSYKWGADMRPIPGCVASLLNLTGALGLSPEEALALAEDWGEGNRPWAQTVAQTRDAPDA